MRKSWSVLFCAFGVCAATACADTIVLRDGASYSGQCIGPNSGQIAFTDGKGIEYEFSASDVRSLVFGRTQDTVTLRNGKVLCGPIQRPGIYGFSRWTGNRL